MKKLGVLLVVVLLVFASCQKKNTIEVLTENVVDNTKVEILVREFGFEQPKVVAEGVIVKGKLVMDNPFTEGEWAYISIKNTTEFDDNILFVGEPGAIIIHFNRDDIDNSTVGGTKNNDKIQAYYDQHKPLTKKLNDYLDANYDKMKKLSETEEGKQSEEFKEYNKECDRFTEEYIEVIAENEKANRDNVFGLVMLAELISSEEKELEDLKENFNQYPEALRTSKFGKKIESYINNLIENGGIEASKFAIGDKLPEFKGLTPLDKELTLSEYLKDKKYVLVDVWASWCGPCRQENPNLVEVYEKYHDKGFDIIGYSLDKDKAAWVKAIKTDKLTWEQVSNLLFWKDPIVSDYGIRGVPANYLIDQSGTIVALDLRGKELEDKVKELLDK